MTSNNYAIGIDLGGTNLRCALVSETGEVLDQVREKTPVKDGPNKTAEVMAQLSLALISRQQGAKKVLGIGIGSPGPLSREKKMIFQN